VWTPYNTGEDGIPLIRKRFEDALKKLDMDIEVESSQENETNEMAGLRKPAMMEKMSTNVNLGGTQQTGRDGHPCVVRKVTGCGWCYLNCTFSPAVFQGLFRRV